MDHPRAPTAPTQRPRPVSTVSGRVKFALSSSVVQPTPTSSVVTKAQPMAESRSVDASPAGTVPTGGVVGDPGGPPPEAGAPVLALDEPEAERRGNWRLRQLACGHPPHHFEAG